MPTLNSHTHCQATPANAKTQAWQRVCLSQRTTKTTDKPTDEKNTEAITAVLQKWRCSASYDSEVVNQNLVLRMKFSGENRHLRKAAKRYDQVQNPLKVSKLAKESPFPCLTVLYHCLPCNGFADFINPSINSLMDNLISLN